MWGLLHPKKIPWTPKIHHSWKENTVPAAIFSRVHVCFPRCNSNNFEKLDIFIRACEKMWFSFFTILLMVPICAYNEKTKQRQPFISILSILLLKNCLLDINTIATTTKLTSPRQKIKVSRKQTLRIPTREKHFLTPSTKGWKYPRLFQKESTNQRRATERGSGLGPKKKRYGIQK